jgi:hypothetical protein
VDVLQWVPLITALGVGSVVGTWFGASRARREARSGVLKAIKGRLSNGTKLVVFVTFV